MNLKEKVITVNNVEEIPNLNEIDSIPRGLYLKIIFKGEAKLKEKGLVKSGKLNLQNIL